MDFLSAGPPPIYVGFGSIVVADAESLTIIIVEAVKLLGVRAIIARGWSGLGSRAELGSEIFVIDGCPHEWLFQHVSCVVHHGGAGTTAAGLTAGKSTVVIPFFGDQFFWGNVVAQSGVGPPALPYRRLTVEKLCESIRTALSPECVHRASELATRLAAEDGASKVVTDFHASLPIDGMRCSFYSNRPAVWRYQTKTLKLSLSALAATVLRKEKLLDLKHLKP